MFYICSLQASLKFQMVRLRAALLVQAVTPNPTYEQIREYERPVPGADLGI